MIRILCAAALSALMAMPATADGEFSKGSQVKGWNNLKGRETAVFKGKIVDVLCELTGECAPSCGAGKRQLGILREKDGKLILAAKNSQAAFNGATEDLWIYCGRTVFVDGLMVGNPELTKTKFYQVFLIRREDGTIWAKTKRWTRVWSKKNESLATRKGPWYRHDPNVQAEIKANGYLGLGADADKKYIEDNE